MKQKADTRKKQSRAKNKKTRQGSSVNTKSVGKTYKGQGR